ncbi:MAG TPA: hypothetical protein VFH61_16345 [Thermoleophilia bacterium]|nr:hypothetical protein [Thermoleophilia bacterium]
MNDQHAHEHQQHRHQTPDSALEPAVDALTGKLESHCSRCGIDVGAGEDFCQVCAIEASGGDLPPEDDAGATGA